MTLEKIVSKDLTEWVNEKGKRHRIDGPAVEYTSGYKAWYLNGRCFSSPEEWLNSLTKDEQIAYLFKME